MDDRELVAIRFPVVEEQIAEAEAASPINGARQYLALARRSWVMGRDEEADRYLDLASMRLGRCPECGGRRPKGHRLSCCFESRRWRDAQDVRRVETP